MKIVKRKLADLKPYENNPRVNKAAVEYVAKSLSQFGWQQPIVIDKDNVIVCGHTRYLAAQMLGWEEAECKIATELTPAQVKAYRLADNKVAEMSAWDYDALAEELEGIAELDDIDMADFGFAPPDDGDIDDLFTPPDDEGNGKEQKTYIVKCPCCGADVQITKDYKVLE